MDCRSIIRGSIPREPAKICSHCGSGGALPPHATISIFWFRRFMSETSHREGKAQFFMPNERDPGPVKTCGFMGVWHSGYCICFASRLPWVRVPLLPPFVHSSSGRSKTMERRYIAERASLEAMKEHLGISRRYGEDPLDKPLSEIGADSCSQVLGT